MLNLFQHPTVDRETLKQVQGDPQLPKESDDLLLTFTTSMLESYSFKWPEMTLICN